MHGGGWQIQSIHTHDGPCRTLAHEAGCIVVSVDYRLTPQFVYPVQVDECYTVLEWIAVNAHTFNGDRRRIAVGGDSAGGNLAAVMALKARDEHAVALKFQLLVHPTVDYYDPGKPSYDQFKEGYGMAALDMKHFFDLYLPHGFDRDDPYIFPLRAKDLRHLPPALIINANFDVLRDEGKLYADRLKEAQVPVKRSVYEGMIHTFFNLRGLLDQSRVALAEAAFALRNAFAVQ
jgi:acetyl esterase